MWCEIHNNPVLRCLVNPKGLSYEDSLDGIVPELVSWLTV
jgi:hypothetical protein